MKRRVEEAKAILGRPRVLFLDEPTSGLDLPSKREMWDFFCHLCRSENVTLFLSRHDVNEIQAPCDRLSVIANGNWHTRADRRGSGRIRQCSKML